MLGERALSHVIHQYLAVRSNYSNLFFQQQ